MMYKIQYQFGSFSQNIIFDDIKDNLLEVNWRDWDDFTSKEDPVDLFVAVFKRYPSTKIFKASSNTFKYLYVNKSIFILRIVSKDEKEQEGLNWINIGEEVTIELLKSLGPPINWNLGLLK